MGYQFENLKIWRFENEIRLKSFQIVRFFLFNPIIYYYHKVNQVQIN